MKDVVGSPQSLLVLGGTSEIALATVRRLITRRARTVWLAGRPSPALESTARQLRDLGADTLTVPFDALAPEAHEVTLGKVFAEGDIDLVLLAFGVLGVQARDETDPPAAVRVAQTNYTGAVSAALICANAMRRQGHGSLVVLSSAAAGRVRRTDFIHASAKAGLDAFARGLGDALRGTGVHVMVVRPGFVRTKLTAGLRPAPLATTPQAVAEAIEEGLRRRAPVVWVPGALRLMTAAPRLLPRAVSRLGGPRRGAGPC
ncbi:SDR family NAD(P)-dependent oxidoreductase [Streptomyces rapamycinicus]|uniref:Short-chain dehydrogenase n=2 Tax=Streptomyces rapamycinicus TaxID=1226757 RepID=A0A0A0NIX8_STRRN|nr:SDR family NAD(P)-dependent oxidoreductase [Streptomyces rapamycinicus]AGP57171.1 short-chain dehydrogenase [Streptomyces rapamycinicus NRRL 5491]MBB4784813.1 decaprenylphospho-beta-D-erythro-pentofuranosid-2-ulose 2-reductase [Streptomyces rapamycinicus]RLV79709.1 short-chain dehydrogenase [Streptomyces rapamycinicus NRRL 5491]UTO65068.1 SDR family NAD(P)-dependent oxidoreductase [Streptomyces rapamycinicus]UTP33024.1 SDR family NAD(P)-dependent oxidoreductase [Streptomyces rapamycinicus N